MTNKEAVLHTLLQLQAETEAEILMVLSELRRPENAQLLASRFETLIRTFETLDRMDQENAWSMFVAVLRFKMKERGFKPENIETALGAALARLRAVIASGQWISLGDLIFLAEQGLQTESQALRKAGYSSLNVKRVARFVAAGGLVVTDCGALAAAAAVTGPVAAGLACSLFTGLLALADDGK